MLLHPDVDAAVFETARGGVLREGLGFDRCDVAVVTNIGIGDHLGLNYISTVEDLAVVKRVIVENVAPGTGVAVLNAADPIVARMADSCPGKVTFFASDRNHPVMATHRAQGKRVVYLRWRCHRRCRRRLRTPHRAGRHSADRQRRHRLPGRKRHGRHRRRLGARHPLGRHPRGLASFVSDAANRARPLQRLRLSRRDADRRLRPQPGCHPGAGQGHRQHAGTARRSVVISGAGDRRDDDIRQQTEILGDAFDEVILYQDACQRGRADGEVLALLRRDWRTPAGPATSRKSTANSSPSIPRWPTSSPATCA